MTDTTQTLRLRYVLGDLDEAEERLRLLGVPFMVLGADGLGRSADIDATLGEVVFWPEDGAEAAEILETARVGPPPLVSWDQSVLEPVDWVEHWRKWFHWTKVSDRLAVGPPWETPPEVEILIRIDPGGAFGTGTHPTTKLSLALLEEDLAALTSAGSAPSMLDVGCGSGVLSIAARLLGAGEIQGVDVDDSVLDECARNALINETPFSASLLPIGEVEGAWDLVVANILPHILLELAADIAARVRPGGRLVLSGVPASDEDFVARFKHAAGAPIRLLEGRCLDDWWGGRFLREAQ